MESERMPIKIPNGLPAVDILAEEGVQVMSEKTALRQDIRPLQIALLNLMPNKTRTETQFARLIGATPLQIELTLVRMSRHESKNTSAEYLNAFYKRWEAVSDQKFDGFIITGAPVELLQFEEVGYWGELQEIFDWTKSSVTSTFAICWGAQAMLHHCYGIPTYRLENKAFGCYRHQSLDPASPLLHGFSDDFVVPVSRWTTVCEADFPAHLNVLVSAEDAGPCLVEDPMLRAFFMFNHIEYDTTSLAEELRRDGVAKVGVPRNYFPEDDILRAPQNRWRSHAFLLFSNWINYVYQATPFELNAIGNSERELTSCGASALSV
jgi:homoserine O-succinyltransferase